VHIIRPKDFSAEIADALASLRLWFIQVVAWMAEFLPLPRDARLWLQQQLIHTRRDLRLMLASAIVAKMRIRKRPHALLNRRGPERGFRWRKRRPKSVHLFTRGIRLRTISDMRRVIDDFDAVVARAFARLPKALKGGIILMICAPTLVCSFIAPAPAAEAADTS